MYVGDRERNVDDYVDDDDDVVLLHSNCHQL